MLRQLVSCLACQFVRYQYGSQVSHFGHGYDYMSVGTTLALFPHLFLSPPTFQIYFDASPYPAPHVCAGDANMRTLQKGDVLQLERKGYYIVDEPYSRPGRSYCTTP